MIEFKNVSKTYLSKKGNSTQALNNINIKIGESGLIFILGKSGSGKSTFLNILGGLDDLSSGEVIVNGENIGKFNDAQYDAYRNTYVGFIFQEFNILEQYNVYENIEISLKLQNKISNRLEIDQLLQKLGIENLGNRRINELSGGQKQRIAIARALIKEPKIILADEPTGNLDQSSSEQIFNILKEISKEKLVIVVSHDRESAEKFADRIVEINDGKIISDNESKVKTKTEKIQLKKSKLPISYALKMALTSFKIKPFKLFMTVLLTTCSLIFMGFAVNCALFDKELLIVNTMKDNSNYVYDVSKQEYKLRGSIALISLEESDFLSIQKLTNSKINKAYSLYDNDSVLKFEYGKNDKSVQYLPAEPYSFVFIEIEDNRIMGNLIGNEPKQNNEFVIHKYLADYIIKFGIMTTDNELYFPKDYNELVNSKKKLRLGDNEVIIVGISNDDDSIYQEIKEKGYFPNDKIRSYYGNNYQAKGRLIYVKGFTNEVKLGKNKFAILNSMAITQNSNSEFAKRVNSNIKSLNEDITIITKDGLKKINSLNSNDIVLSTTALKAFDPSFDSKFNTYLLNHSDGVYDELLKDFTANYMKEKEINLSLLIYKVNYLLEQPSGIDVRVIGISIDDNNYVSQKYVDDYEPITKEVNYVTIYDDDVSHTKKVLSKLVFLEFPEDIKGIHYTYTLDNALDLANIINAFKELSIYILIVSLVFILFTFLLFSNFISISISYCKKEIGILRALGASNKDIIKIFGYESTIIGLLSWILFVIGWFIICNLLNNSIFGSLYYELNGIVTHPLIPIIMFIYTITIAIIVTAVSISRVTHIKPIDAILNK